MRAIECVVVVACVLMKALAAEPSCPMCSKYHYDEMVLERMIRNEIKWEQIVNDIKAINDKVNSALQVIDGASVKNQKQVVDEANMKIENCTLGLEKQKQVFDEVNVKIQSLTLGLEKQKLDVDILRLHSQSHAVAFSAHGFNLLSNKVNAFPTVIFNEGNAYDASTGHFTAPVDGLYSFTVQICLQTSKHASFHMEKGVASMSGALRLTTTFNTAHANGACTSPSSYVKLTKHEHVWVLMADLYTSYTIWESQREAWNTFTGALIQAL